MDIVNFGHFTVINPGSYILSYQNEEGQDWYALRNKLTNWDPETGDFIDAVFGTWVTVDPDGVVIHVEFNPSKIVPDDKTVLGIDADHTKIQKGMRWTGSKLMPPTKATLEKVGPPL